MSHRSASKLDVMKSVSGIAGATVTLIILIACIATVHANSSAPPAVRSWPATSASDPTGVAGRITSNLGRVAATETGEAPVVSGGITSADGFIPADITLSPFDVDHPAVGKLNPDLLSAIQHAAGDAANDGVEIRINSGWRSTRYQQQLLDDAVIKYGSEAEARKWVNTPEKSAHVAGEAVDIAPTAADEWLERHGNQYGLCQIYSNEIWHFELAVEPGADCPRPKTDASDG